MPYTKKRKITITTTTTTRTRTTYTQPLTPPPQMQFDHAQKETNLTSHPQHALPSKYPSHHKNNDSDSYLQRGPIQRFERRFRGIHRQNLVYYECIVLSSGIWVHPPHQHSQQFAAAEREPTERSREQHPYRFMRDKQKVMMISDHILNFVLE